LLRSATRTASRPMRHNAVRRRPNGTPTVAPKKRSVPSTLLTHASDREQRAIGIRFLAGGEGPRHLLAVRATELHIVATALLRVPNLDAHRSPTYPSGRFQMFDETLTWHSYRGGMGAVTGRYPLSHLKIALSEGRIGWLPLVMDWMDHTTRTHNEWTHGWDGVDLLPSEVLLRNFWFCSIDEPRGTRALSHTIGTDRVMLEVDCPHADSTWPDTRSYLDQLRRFLSPDEVQAITWKTACSLFRHPAPG
jgi:Amidohydrolase